MKKNIVIPKEFRIAFVQPETMTAMLAEPDISNADLVGLVQSGDRSAFTSLVGRHYDFVFRVAWRWCGHRSDAEDIAQEVCARLGRSIRSYRGGGAFTTWLYALTLNAARDLGRSRAREQARTQAFGVQTLIDGQAGAEPDDRAERLWAAVRQLPDKQRDAVLLVHGEGLSHAAAADVMAVSEPTVSWHIHEAKKRLKRVLSAGEE